MAILTVSDHTRDNIPEPFTLVIFGATGDLTHRKLIPAVFNLFCQNLLPQDFSVIGFARREYDDQLFRQQLRQSLESLSPDRPIDEECWARFTQKVFYHQTELTEPDGYHSLRQRIERETAQNQTPGNSLFYLATPPEYFTEIINQLNQAGLAHRGAYCSPWSRIIIEKPFGRDLETARALNAHVGEVFDERQIYRIDHYLGKETVQNLLVFRFANSIFEPIWNQKYIDHVQIAVLEEIGIGTRGAYYDQAGAIRDIVQNHMMHLLSLVAMEPPVALEADAVRDEKVKILKALRPMPAECVGNHVVRAQYAAGTSAGKQVPGYLEESGVADGSLTETFVAMKVFIDNWRWAGIPFYLRTGKCMPVRITEIDIHFRSVPDVLFNTGDFGPMQPNLLAIRIQPNEGISLQFQVKTPGPEMRIQPFKMDFGYAGSFGKAPPEAYERLLLDAALGDSTLFARGDEVDAAWSYLTNILQGCAGQPVKKLPQYPAGTWGPTEGDELLATDNRFWSLIKRPSYNK
jgi:glucose-6-phosphate 1-dehydrogenase